MQIHTHSCLYCPNTHTRTHTHTLYILHFLETPSLNPASYATTVHHLFKTFTVVASPPCTEGPCSCLFILMDFECLYLTSFISLCFLFSYVFDLFMFCSCDAYFLPIIVFHSRILLLSYHPVFFILILLFFWRIFPPHSFSHL